MLAFAKDKPATLASAYGGARHKIRQPRTRDKDAQQRLLIPLYKVSRIISNSPYHGSRLMFKVNLDLNRIRAFTRATSVLYGIVSSIGLSDNAGY